MLIQDGQDGFIAIVFIEVCPVTGCIQALVANFGSIVQDPLAGFIGLLGMLPSGEDLGDVLLGLISDCLCPFKELLRGPVGLELVFARKMIIYRAV